MATTAAPPDTTESRARELLAETFAGTPGRLRIFGAAAVAACLLFGVLAFAIGTHLHAELRAARAHAAQLVRIQTIRTNLVKADANATNAFLLPGLEGSDVRAGYTDGIATAAATIAQAASAEPADANRLEKVNQILTTYTGTVESARANNRQNFPIGAAYMRNASNTLRNDALPPLQQLADEQRADFSSASDSATTASTELGVVLVVALGALIVTQVWLYRRTRRIFNRPLVVATALVLAGGVVGLLFIGFSRNQVQDARDGPFADTVALATARSNAFDAKSDESLTLIARGNGAPFEQDFQQLVREARNALTATGNAADPATADSLSRLDAYVTTHTQVRKLDDGGNHDAAVKLATPNGAAYVAFTAFESASGAALTARAQQLSNSLDDASKWLVAVSWFMLLAGIAAALFARRGIAERLREYR
jgi:hypothetical protein